MDPSELREEMQAMWDSILHAAFGVDSIDDLAGNQIQEAMRLWRDEIREHPEALAMEALIEQVAEQWPEE